MAKIFIWEPNGGNVGHCSLMLDDEFYISFWPNDSYGPIEALSNKTVASTKQTYEEDCDVENGSPNTIIEVGKLDNELIRKWWNANYTCGYSVSNNCSTMVEKALEVGKLNPKRLRELQNQLAEWRRKVTKIVTENHKGGGVKYRKGVKRLNDGH